MAARFPEESVGAQRGAGGGPPANQAAEAEEARPGAQRGRSPEPWGLDQGGGSGGGAGQGRARQPDASRGSSSPRPSSRDRVPEGGFGQIKGADGLDSEQRQSGEILSTSKADAFTSRVKGGFVDIQGR